MLLRGTNNNNNNKKVLGDRSVTQKVKPNAVKAIRVQSLVLSLMLLTFVWFFILFFNYSLLPLPLSSSLCLLLTIIFFFLANSFKLLPQLNTSPLPPQKKCRKKKGRIWSGWIHHKTDAKYSTGTTTFSAHEERFFFFFCVRVLIFFFQVKEDNRERERGVREREESVSIIKEDHRERERSGREKKVCQ